MTRSFALSRQAEFELYEKVQYTARKRGTARAREYAGRIDDAADELATNIGIVLLETGRWVEALDFFQKGRFEWPGNGVAALREMQCLMGFCNAARDNPERFEIYSDRGQIHQRIVELSRVVEDTYTEIRKLAGEGAVDHAMHAIKQV